MNYVVTTSIGRRTEDQITRKEVWHTDHPMKIGHPLQWLIETTDKGVRITDLRGSADVIFNNHVQELTHEQLADRTVVELHNGRHAVRLKIEPAAITHPINHVQGDILKIYRTMGDWVLDSFTLESSKVNTRQTVTLGKREIFHTEWTNPTTLQITPSVSHLVLKQGAIRKELEPKDKLTFDKNTLANVQLELGSSQWHFGFASSDTIAHIGSDVKIPTIDLAKDTEADYFKNALRAAAIGLVTFLLVSWLWPRQKEDAELIPAQMAKIILTTPKKVASGAQESAPATNSPVQKKVQETAVVQAFRAKALQNAVSGLMKGGMSKLLAQSDFVTGHKNADAARRMFDTHSETTKATAPDIGDMNNKNVAVAALGGDGAANGTGKAVGYGKGEHAGVKGQGKGFVSMDIGNSTVEEGLTKDEVGEVIHRHLSEVRYCYESAMIRQPDIEGKLVVDFTIGGNGVVKSAEAKSSTLPDPRLDDCIIRRLVTWKFPNTKGGVDVAVSYPFIFKTLGR
jgi:outer membrane biosynthesis protein TonB